MLINNSQRKTCKDVIYAFLVKNVIGFRQFFVDGPEYVINKLQPSTIVIYGVASDKIFSQYRGRGIVIIQFDSEFRKSLKKVSI